MILYLHEQTEEQWLPPLDGDVTIVNTAIDFSDFVEANRDQLNDYRYLIADVKVLLNTDGDFDDFAIREYDGAAELIILNQMKLKLAFVKQRGLMVIDTANDCKDFFDRLGLLKKDNQKQEMEISDRVEKQEMVVNKKVTDKMGSEKRKRDSVPKTTIVKQKAERVQKREIILPKFELPKFGSKSSQENRENLIVEGRQEIGFMGAVKGVGTTFAAFYYAKKYLREKKTVAVVSYNDRETGILVDALKETAIHVFAQDEIRQALEHDIVIYDFGVLNRDDRDLLKEFERCHKRYIVTSLAFHKKYAMNNVLQYFNETSLNFTTIFNFISDDELSAVKKVFRVLTCNNLAFHREI